MTPSLDQMIGLVRMFSFGISLMVAFLVGTFVFWKKGGDEYYDQSALLDVLIFSSFWGLISARIGFILLHFSSFGFDILKWFSLSSYPGYWGIAGMLGGCITLIIQAKKRKWDPYETSDFAALGLSIALVCIYLGMFLNGSGFGNTTLLPIGMSFPGVFDQRHPTQLYAALLYCLLFVSLWKLEQVYRTFLWYRSNKRTSQTGFLFSVFLMGYGLIGVLLAFVQPSMVTVFGIHIEGVLRGVIIVVGGILLFKRSGRSVLKKKTGSGVK